MPRPQKVQDLYVVNGWWLDMPGLISPHFETLEGVQKGSGNVEIVDAGTNTKYKFGTQIIDYGEMTLTRTYQGTPDDKALEAIVDQMIQDGMTYDVVAVKTHHKREVFRIQFTGFRIQSSNFPTFDVNGEDKFIVSYTATCNGWKIVR